MTTEFVRNVSKASETIAPDTKELVEKPVAPREENRGNNIDTKA